MSKKAFTLAEVLITLGIIGIVAAITIPMIITNYQKRQAVSQLKVAYALLSDAVKMSEDENGEISQWNFMQDTQSFVQQYFKPHLKMSDLGCYYSINTTPCISPLSKTGKGQHDYYQIKSLGKWDENGGSGYNNGNLHGNTNGYIYSLPNGMLVTIAIVPDIENCVIRVDLNGFKGPNILGKDVFTFSIPRKSRRLLPGNNDRGASNHYDKSITTLLQKGGSYNVGTCHIEGVSNFGIIRGDACSVVIIKSGWEIPKEYPWK